MQTFMINCSIFSFTKSHNNVVHVKVLQWRKKKTMNLTYAPSTFFSCLSQGSCKGSQACDLIHLIILPKQIIRKCFSNKANSIFSLSFSVMDHKNVATFMPLFLLSPSPTNNFCIYKPPEFCFSCFSH